MSVVSGDLLPGLIGHELRNPLASAMTGAMLAREMVDEGDPRAQVLDGVLRDLDRMTGLIDGWLQMARGEHLEGQRIDLERLLQDVARTRRVELVSLPPSLAVTGNRCLLARVLENLCDNARNAGAEHVRVAAQRDGGTVHVHVEDDGVGVDADDVERVFEPGWSASGGTGLGLHAVAASVRAMGGDVRCVPLARGTRFTLQLPRWQQVAS